MGACSGRTSDQPAFAHLARSAKSAFGVLSQFARYYILSHHPMSDLVSLLNAGYRYEARSFMISTLRSQVGFAAAVAHARLRLSVSSSSGALAAPPAATRLPRAPSFRRPPSSRRGEALWEQVVAGSGSLGAASSESAAGSGRLRGCRC